MSRTRLFLLVAALLVVTGPALTQPKSKPAEPARAAPKLVPIAETRLLMEGLNTANFKGFWTAFSAKSQPMRKPGPSSAANPC